MTLLRGMEISQRSFAEERLSHADLVLRPDFGERVNVLDFSAIDDVVRSGVVSTRANLEQITKLLAG